MKIVLIRHGEAEGFRSSDAERALTTTGQAQARLTGRWLSEVVAGTRSLQLLASPYRRAQQTAAEVGELLQLPVGTVEAITPDTDPRVALAALEAVALPVEWIVVVSHMPLVAALACWLEDGVLGSGQGFALAEARILEAEQWGSGLATLQDRFVPAR